MDNKGPAALMDSTTALAAAADRAKARSGGGPGLPAGGPVSPLPNSPGGGAPGAPPPPFTSPGLAGSAGGAPAPEGPEAGAEPPPGSGYLDFTPNLGKGHNPEACKGYWLTRTCGCTRTLIWAGGCGRRGCHRCGWGKSQVSAGRLFDRVYHGVKGHLQTMVITCPLPLRSTFEGPIGATRWNTSVALLIDALKAEMGLTWCYCRSHPAGEDGKVFAPHANLLWHSSIQAGRLDTDRIRALWAAALGCTGPVVVDCGYLTLDDFVGRSQLRHWCNYVERCFPGWSWLGQWARYYGQYPPAPDSAQEKADHDYCPECGQAYQLSEPGEKDFISIAGFETLLDSGQPVHPKNARAWCVVERIPPRAPEPKAQVLEQSVLFREGGHQTWHTERPEA